MNKKPPKKDNELTEKLLNEVDYWVYCAILYFSQAWQSDEIQESEISKKETKEELHKRKR